MGQCHGAQIGSALVSTTLTKTLIRAQPNLALDTSTLTFTLLIDKALYGLCISGACFYERLLDSLCAMNFVPCKEVGVCVCMYVNYIARISQNPKGFFDALVLDHHYTLKGVGPLTYFLGGDFAHNSIDNTLAVSAKMHIKRII